MFTIYENLIKWKRFPFRFIFLTETESEIYLNHQKPKQHYTQVGQQVVGPIQNNISRELATLLQNKPFQSTHDINGSPDLV